MIAAVYARKSTDQNGIADDQKSVARQVEHARAYAKAKGWTVAEEQVYVDDGISGAEFATRPGFVRLMAALKPKAPFQVLVMSEESRLGREQIEVSYALKQLVQGGVRVFFYLEDRERTLDSPTDKIMLSLAAFADELEREKARQRTKDAMTRKARAGHVAGGDCFGYKNREVLAADGSRSHVLREIDTKTAPTVRRIFDLCAQGLGVARIAKLLNEERAPSPRPRQGRPRAWAPSSVRAVLYRDAYRGVVIWNKSQKRDGWGQEHRRRRPESEWLTVQAPQLRIVTDAQWNSAHARLAAARSTYLRQQNGRVWGRPPAGIASKYLLTGLARCGECGCGLEVRSRASGRTRQKFYACAGYHRRGRTVCTNKTEIPMRAADAAATTAMLEEILTAERLATVAERAVEIARSEREGSSDLRADVERQLRDCEVALGRLTAAVAAGGDVPALVEAIKGQEGQRRALEGRLEALSSPVPTFDGALERRLRAAVKDWRSVLGAETTKARQIVQKLLAEKIVFLPEDRGGRRGFRFQAVGTVEKLISGAVPGFPQAVVPRTDRIFEPHRESAETAVVNLTKILPWLEGLHSAVYAAQAGRIERRQ